VAAAWLLTWLRMSAIIMHYHHHHHHHHHHHAMCSPTTATDLDRFLRYGLRPERWQQATHAADVSCCCLLPAARLAIGPAETT
jgi:hypothetical protein